MKYSYHITEIDKNKAMSFVQSNHYSPVMPKITKHFLGIHCGHDLVGVLTLGWGTQPKQTIKKLFPELTTTDYLEIGKMCMLDTMPKNSESQMISQVVKWIKKYKKGVKFLYTLADGIMGKCGYVYQASNFYYGGFFWTDVFMTSTGEKVHPRSMKRILKANADFKSVPKLYWPTSDYLKFIGMRRIKGKMFRYIFPLNKQAKKLLKNGDWSIDHPKDSDLVWREQVGAGSYEEISKPEFSYKKATINKKNINQIKKHFDQMEMIL